MDNLLDVDIIQTCLADKAYDADARVIELIKAVSVGCAQRTIKNYSNLSEKLSEKSIELLPQSSA